MESITEEFVKKTIQPCENCIRDSGFRKENIDDVLLVGGMSRMPKI